MLSALKQSPLERVRCLTAEQLKLLAMTLMLCDHLWATLFPAQDWLTALGRLAFPIFAFQIAEGFARTHDAKRYRRRMFLFALLSEIPFDLIMGGSVFYPFHQNVLFTFWLALWLLCALERAKNAPKPLYLLWGAALMAVGYVAGTLTMVDYFGCGVATVLLFYLCRDIPFGWLLQLVGLWYFNVELLGGYYYEFTLLGHPVSLCQQGLAVLALLPIWLYNGKPGGQSRVVRRVCYVFYPAHLLVLYLLWQLIM